MIKWKYMTLRTTYFLAHDTSDTEAATPTTQYSHYLSHNLPLLKFNCKSDSLKRSKQKHLLPLNKLTLRAVLIRIFISALFFRRFIIFFSSVYLMSSVTLVPVMKGNLMISNLIVNEPNFFSQTSTKSYGNFCMLCGFFLQLKCLSQEIYLPERKKKTRKPS